MLKQRSHVNQDEFIKYISDKNVSVKLYLVNGIKLEGVVMSYDIDSITLVKENHSILVYKHAIGTISPDECMPVFQS